MRQIDIPIVRLCSSAALVAAGLGAATTPASASETWRFERVRGGGYAQSCDRFGGQRVCATVYCGRGADGLEIGLTGWEPRGRGERRDGRIAVDGRGRNAQYELDDRSPAGEVWRADLGRGESRVIDRIKGGLRLSVDIAARDRAYEFTLNGSSRAISQLERRCDSRVASDESAEIRIGDDDFGITLRFGDDDDGDRRRDRDRSRRPNLGSDWEQLASNRVNRRRDRDVIELDRRDGRFDALRLVALDNDVRVRRVQVRYGNGSEESLDVDRRIEAGDASNVIELRGRNGRFIDRITLVYDTQDRGRRAEVEVWGHEADRRARGPNFGPNWERVASNRVDRRRDRDVIQLDRGDDRFDALRFRALDNDVRVRRVLVRYGNGVEHGLDVNGRIEAGEASDVIDLRGRNGRTIDQITLVYDTQGRGRRAQVEVWGRHDRG